MHHSPDPQLDEICCIEEPEGFHGRFETGVYKAVSKEATERALDELEGLWGAQYPIVIKSWRSKWETLSGYFKYPADIRRVCTTKAIEAMHRLAN